MTGKHSMGMPMIWKHIKDRAGRGTFKNQVEVRRWLDKNNLVPHHAYGDKIQLIDKQVHGIISHNGGASLLRSGL